MPVGKEKDENGHRGQRRKRIKSNKKGGHLLTMCYEMKSVTNFSTSGGKKDLKNNKTLLLFTSPHFSEN